MKTLNKIYIAVAFLTTSLLSAQAVITNNVPSAISSNKTFKLKGVNMNSRNNPFKVTIAAYNADGSTGDKLDITSSTRIRKKEDRSFVANITVPNVQADLKVKLCISGGNVAEADPQSYIALLLSDPAADSNIELENDGFSLGGSSNSSAGTPGQDGQDGAIGPTGPKGDRGDPGLVAIDGGRLDVDPLFNIPDPFIPVLRSAVVESGVVNVGNSTFFIVTDSDPSTTDIIGNLTGAQTPGQKVTILFEAKAMVTNSEYIQPNVISLHEEPTTKRLSLIEGTRFDNFKPGDTLVLIYDGNSWFEISRTTTYDPAYDHLRITPE